MRVTEGLCALMLVPGSACAVEALDEVRAVSKAFVAEIEQGLVNRALARFVPAAFRSPITGQIVCFSGGGQVSGSALRDRVRESLRQIAAAPRTENAGVLRELVEAGEVPPANLPEADGFAVWWIDAKVRPAIEKEAIEHDEPAAAWMAVRSRKSGRVAAVFAMARGVPLAVIWERHRWRGWRITGFTVFCR